MLYVALLCLGYFISYTVYGVVVRYFIVIEKMPGMEFLFHSTVAGVGLVTGIVLLLWWPGRHKSSSSKTFLGIFPVEYVWLIPSGICTGFVIPTTSLMYTFGFSVMVAMIIMRGSLIVISRVVDEVLIRQGLSDKKVYWQENMAVLVAMIAVSLPLIYGGKKPGSFDFFHSPLFVLNMACYIIPYGFRLYILSRFKTKMDSRALFGIEQLWAAVTVVGGIVLTVWAFRTFNFAPQPVTEFVYGVMNPNLKAIAWSLPYGVVAFVSVFIYIYKFGSATFNCTINRLTSLLAGTTATLISYFLFQGKPVDVHEWWAFMIIVLAIGFLTWAGKRREAERSGKRVETKEFVGIGAPATAPLQQ